MATAGTVTEGDTGRPFRKSEKSYSGVDDRVTARVHPLNFFMGPAYDLKWNARI